VILLNPDYRVPFANRFFEERFGKSRAGAAMNTCSIAPSRARCARRSRCSRPTPPFAGVDRPGWPQLRHPRLPLHGRGRLAADHGVGLDITERKQAAAELTKHREHLQELVSERTFELRATNKELARFNQAMVGRELRMIELKQESTNSAPNWPAAAL